jgi:hypothetical protein
MPLARNAAIIAAMYRSRPFLPLAALVATVIGGCGTSTSTRVSHVGTRVSETQETDGSLTGPIEVKYDHAWPWMPPPPELYANVRERVQASRVVKEIFGKFDWSSIELSGSVKLTNHDTAKPMSAADGSGTLHIKSPPSYMVVTTQWSKKGQTLYLESLHVHDPRTAREVLLVVPAQPTERRAKDVNVSTTASAATPPPPTAAEQPQAMTVEKLIDRGMRGTSLTDMDTVDFDQQDVDRIVARIDESPDIRSYQLLFYLAKKHPKLYANVGKATKAAILCSAMKREVFLNDWGILPTFATTKRPWIAPALDLLIDLGPDVLPSLLPLLEDKRPGLFSGSSDATESTVFRYRRCDFACYAGALILREAYVLRETMEDRDIDIEKMTARIRARISDLPREP